MVRQPQICYGPPPSGGGSLFAFVYRLTRKRALEFLEAHLITCDILLELVAHIFFYRLFIATDCIYVVPPAPEVPISDTLYFGGLSTYGWI